jgi:RNA polymerase sigma-70 factor (ECF subfamily)
MSKDEFRQLYLEQRKRLVRLVYRWGTTLDEADEVVQEAFEALWRKILDGDHLESQIAFLLTVCRNKTLNLLTNSYRKNRLLHKSSKQNSEGEDLFESETRADESVEDEFSDAKLRQDCVKQKLHLFESDHPEASYALRLQLQGSPIIKIAAAISRSEEATRQYLYQSRKRMKPYLEECRE